MSWKVKLAWKERKENQVEDIMTPGMEGVEWEPQERLDLQYDHTLNNILPLWAFKYAVYQTLSSSLIRALKETPLLAQRALRGHLDHLEEGMMDHLGHQGHLVLQDRHWMELTGAHRVSYLKYDS